MREIDRESSKLSLKYSENVLAETNKYTLHIKEEDEGFKEFNKILKEMIEENETLMKVILIGNASVGKSKIL